MDRNVTYRDRCADPGRRAQGASALINTNSMPYSSNRGGDAGPFRARHYWSIVRPDDLRKPRGRLARQSLRRAAETRR
jgi:hypothetical protein